MSVINFSKIQRSQQYKKSFQMWKVLILKNWKKTLDNKKMEQK